MIDLIELIENYKRRYFDINCQKNFDKTSRKINLKKFFAKQTNVSILTIRLRFIKLIIQHVSRFKIIISSFFNNHYYRDEILIDKIK